MLHFWPQFILKCMEVESWRTFSDRKQLTPNPTHLGAEAQILSGYYFTSVIERETGLGNEIFKM